MVGRNVLQLVIGDEKSAASAPIVEMLLNHAGRILRHSELYPFVNIQAGDRGPYDVLHSSSSFPPIILAIIKKREDLVQLLLSDKLPTDLQVSASQFANESPLMAAIEHGTVGIMKLLLKKGSSDLNHQDLWRGTPLWSACSQSHTSSEKLQMLLNHENGIINPNTLDLRGYTPLLTCALKSFRATELLLSHFKTRLDISQPSLKGFSILHHAVDSHHASNSIEFVRLFLNAARESGQLFRILERKNPSSGMNPLHLVSHFSGVTTATENRDIAALLVESAMSLNNSSLIINSADDYGNTPLMRALSFSNPTANNVAVISILLEKGFANVNLRNHIGETAADIAFGNGRSDKGYLLECKMIIKPLTEEEKE